MQCFGYDIELLSVPHEISLAFAIYGCPLACCKCFWAKLKNTPTFTLDNKVYHEILENYQEYVSCILFFGGEWHQEQLVERLKVAQSLNLKTCLYTGLTEVSPKILTHLNYVKIGPYREEYGGLNYPTTNQKILNLDTNEDITHLMWKIY